MRITIKDIAKIAGVSHTTVIKALKDKPRISNELKEKIKKIAEKNNYIVNTNARNLALNENRIIGMVISDISIPLLAELTKSVEEVARSYGYNVIVCCSENNADNENSAVMSLLQLRVSGIIIAPSYRGSEFVKQLKKSTIPFIVLGKIEGIDIDYITFDDMTATYNATKYLIKNGHRRIMCISDGDVAVYPYKSWIDGYKKALDEAGIIFDAAYVVECKSDPNSGYTSSREFEYMKKKPSAIINFSDRNITGIVKGLKDSNLRIPEDVSVIVLQDNDMFKYTEPSLSAVLFPKYQLGRITAEYLLKKIIDKKDDTMNIMLPTDLIIRDSTCKCNDKTSV